MTKKRALIIGAAGRDFHNFNTFFRSNDHYTVVAFTAAQIPDIDGRKYPSVLAGDLYPEGIPIYDESELTNLIKDLKVDDEIFKVTVIRWNEKPTSVKSYNYFVKYLPIHKDLYHKIDKNCNKLMIFLYIYKYY